jgi:hypothetical protein
MGCAPPTGPDSAFPRFRSRLGFSAFSGPIRLFLAFRPDSAFPRFRFLFSAPSPRRPLRLRPLPPHAGRSFRCRPLQERQRASPSPRTPAPRLRAQRLRSPDGTGPVRPSSVSVRPALLSGFKFPGCGARTSVRTGPPGSHTPPRARSCGETGYVTICHSISFINN